MNKINTLKIDARKIRLSLTHPWRLSRNTSKFKENVIVTIEKDGITGFGEAAPNVRYGEDAPSTINEIKKVNKSVLDYNLSQYEQIEQNIKLLISSNSCARAALDMALLDWLGKFYNKPVYQILSIPENTIQPTSYSIGIDNLKTIEAKVKEATDYKILKVKLGTDHDQEIISTIRRISDKPIRVDVNEGWKDKYEALEKINRLQSQGIELVEQPMPAEMIDETAWLKEQVKIPIIADEAVKTSEDIPLLVNIYDGINIKLMKAGGIQESLRMIHLAKENGLKVMLGCMIETSLGISAALQLAAIADYIDLDGHLLITNDPFDGIHTTAGCHRLTDKPGLGIVEKKIYSAMQ